MKRCSRILLRVGFVVGLVVGGLLFLSAIAFIVFGLPPIVAELFKDNTSPDKDAALFAFSVAFISSGVTMLVLAILSVLSSVYARKAIVEQNDRSAYIATIVFGALINEIALAGAIVGLIAYRNDYPKADVIDVESK